MGGRTAWVLGEQLSHDNPALEGADRVLLIESESKLRSAPWHRQKLHLVLSAMRHFAAELRERGLEVDHRRERTYAEGVRKHRNRFGADEVTLLEPSSLAGRRDLATLDGVRMAEGALFLTGAGEFADWAGGRKRLVMEDFYRWQRRRLDVLMDGDEPAEGRWNFDAENREPLPDDRRPPRPYRPRESAIDDEVRRDLDRMGLDLFGEDRPRQWPATRDEARRSLQRFVADRLPDFGPWQDAMLAGEQWMWHSHVSSSLNLGLLSPLEVVRAVERAWREGHAPIASVEGFVRQVIGWREYVWGAYRLYEGDWRSMNALDAHSDLPEAFWSGETDMNCLSDSVRGVRETAYAHHIQRLMVFGNLMLLLGTEPRQAYDWFHHSFVDGYEWVMGPNAVGMATFADGGRMMTKPYAAGGRYVDRMSDLCRGCRYEPTERTGEDACPLTTLYWDFHERNEKHLAGNRRLRNAYRQLDRFGEDERAEIRRRAHSLRNDFRA